MASVPAWKPSGAARSWPVVAARAARCSRCVSRRSTRAPESRSFPRAQRLTRGSDLEIVRLQGKRVRTGCIEGRAIASPRAFLRVGFIVPRYKHSAVDRNRLKRRLRELVRTGLLPVLPLPTGPGGAPFGLDIVLRAAPHAYTRDFAALSADVERLVRGLAALTLPPPPAP